MLRFTSQSPRGGGVGNKLRGSARHPMIQLSDLAIFCVRKFFEMDGGYRPRWSNEAKRFYAECFDLILPRLKWKTPVEQLGPEAVDINVVVRECFISPSRGWKEAYGLAC